MCENSIIEAIEDLIDSLEVYCINRDFIGVVEQRKKISRGLELLAERVWRKKNETSEIERFKSGR